MKKLISINSEKTDPDMPWINKTAGVVLESAETGIKKIIDPINSYSSYVSAGFALFMAAAIIFDLAARFLFNYSIVGMIEFETFLLICMCFLSLAHTLKEEGHVSVDILTNKLSAKTRLFLDVIFSIFGLVLFAIMAWQVIIRAVESYNQGELANITLIPYYPFYFLVVFGCSATALVFLSNLLRSLLKIIHTYRRPFLWISLALAVSLIAIAFPVTLKYFNVELGSIGVSLLFISIMILLLLLGFPVAFAMGTVGFSGTWYLTEFRLSLEIVKMVTYDDVAHYYYCVIPFFILMGFLCLEAGIGTKLYNIGSKWFGQLPGGLAIGTVMGCGGFAAICGDSMATAATMGSVSIPEMKKYKYEPSLSTASVAAGGTLGILIPPSIGFIAYAIVTEQAIGKLFMAGIVPGILLMIGFALMIYVRCKIRPTLGPKAPKSSFYEKMYSLKEVWPIAILFTIVIGGIYSGVITPTEAGGVGAIGALIIALFSGLFSCQGFFNALMITTQISGMVLTILIGVGLFGYFITLTDLPVQLAESLNSLQVSKYVLLALILLLYLFLGMLMNIIPMIMLTLPIIFPTVMMLGFDPIWFGVVMVIIMETGQITPPVGINVFIIHGIAGDVPMLEIYKGIVPFVLVQLLVIIIITIFPDIVMWLPNGMDVLSAIG